MNAPRSGFPFPALHWLALGALAVAQPLFDILSRHVQFFVTSNSSSAEILGLAFVFTLLPGALLLGCFRVAAWLSPRYQEQSGAVLLGILTALLLATLLNQWGVTSTPVFAALLLTGTLLLTGLYLRSTLLRSFVDFLGLALVLVPSVFLYKLLLAGPLAQLNQVAAAEGGSIEKPVPVFFLVIDEVPVFSLQLESGEIDALRFPQFARLAATSDWYRTATTVADSTEVAIPALLTGLRPDPGWNNPTASASRHPRNLFTALAPHYEINAYEPITR